MPFRDKEAEVYETKWLTVSHKGRASRAWRESVQFDCRVHAPSHWTTLLPK